MELENPTAKSNLALLSSKTISNDNLSDVAAILAMKATIEDVCPGRIVTDQKAGGSFTSTAHDVATAATIKLATPEDIRDARWTKMREVCNVCMAALCYITLLILWYDRLVKKGICKCKQV